MRNFIYLTILTNGGGALGQLSLGAKVTFSWPVFIGGTYLGALYTGIIGVNDYKTWEQRIYSKSELKIISKYNNELYIKLGGRGE